MSCFRFLYNFWNLLSYYMSFKTIDKYMKVKNIDNLYNNDDYDSNENIYSYKYIKDSDGYNIIDV